MKRALVNVDHVSSLEHQLYHLLTDLILQLFQFNHLRLLLVVREVRSSVLDTMLAIHLCHRHRTQRLQLILLLQYLSSLFKTQVSHLL